VAVIFCGTFFIAQGKKSERLQPVAIDFDKQSLDISQQIEDRYRHELYLLNGSAQSHFSSRMYRISQNEEYLQADVSESYRLASEISWLSNNMNARFIEQWSKEKYKNYGIKLRSQLRKVSVEKNKEFLYYTNLLKILRRLDEYNLCHPQVRVLEAAVSSYSYKPHLLDSTMIQAWAAQLANYVYWLQQLGFSDYRADYAQAFRATYPDDKDSELSDQQYTNKVYGMTHIIFASSQYYQHNVRREKYSWIYDYFDNNIQQILARTKNDVIAEVGIAYQLAKVQGEHLNTLKHAIIKAVDHKQKMIPSVEGAFDFPSGKHRNTMAVILLSMSDSLYPGPHLAKLEKTASHLDPRFRHCDDAESTVKSSLVSFDP